MVKLFSKNSNLCDHNSPTLQTDGQTDRQTTCNRNTALCSKVHRAVKIDGSRDLGHAPFGENYWCACWAFPRVTNFAISHFSSTLCTKFEVSSSGSFEDIEFWRKYWILKILGVTWPKPRPLWGKFCIFLFKFAKIYQCDKYEVSTFYIPVIYTKMAIAHALCHVTVRGGPARTKN